MYALCALSVTGGVSIREAVMQEMRRHARVRAWWGIMMVILLWLALLHHTFRYMYMYRKEVEAQ